MIRSYTFAGEKIGVFGLGRSGLAAARSLDAGGASVFAWDDNLVSSLNPEIPLENLYNADFGDFNGLVVAPGVPLTHALVEKAKAVNLDVFGDIELFGRTRDGLPKHKVVGITGTNGKSTTTALLAHVLDQCQVPTSATGNIGIPVLEQEPLPEGGVYVFELSSFQLDLTSSLNPEYAVFLNITPDHLDRHGGMKGYIKAKKRLLDMQDKDGIVVVNIDDEINKSLTSKIIQRVIPISVKGPVKEGYFIEGGHIFETLNSHKLALGDVPVNPNLRGEHNWQNMLCVIAVARDLGLDAKSIFQALKGFEGLRHRLESLGKKDGVLFINDSKATNSAATSKALQAFDDIHWIAGGEYKEENFDFLTSNLDHVKKAYFIGRDGPQLGDGLGQKIPFTIIENLELAFKKAFQEAKEGGGGVVLLSPACASYDQFKNYQARGDLFINLVSGLIKEGQS